MSRRTVDGKYEIIEKRGGGAMGQVFLAKDTRLDRPVAIKFLNPGIAENAKARKRFLDEGRKLAKLGHQANLATIYDCGEENDQPYMVLEFVDGIDMEKILVERGPMPTEVAVPILLEVLAGIEHAHSKGVVHRDIKPSNILLTRDGHPKVIDFGIAFDPDTERRTVAGDILCTPTYAAPEQAAGKTEEIDHQSDLYSLGTVFFEMLTGKPPLEKASPNATLIAHATEDAPSLPERFGTGLITTVNRSLAREKTNRFRSTGEFKAALEEAVPPANLSSSTVTEFLSKSSPARETVFEKQPETPFEFIPKVAPKKKAFRVSWLTYAGAGVFVLAVALGLWGLKVRRELSAPVPPPPLEIKAPLPPKGWDIVSLPSSAQPPQVLANVPKTPRPPVPPALTAEERTALEASRAGIEKELKKNSAALDSLKALGENPSRQSELAKLCADLKDQVDAIDKKLSAH